MLLLLILVSVTLGRISDLGWLTAVQHSETMTAAIQIIDSSFLSNFECLELT